MVKRFGCLGLFLLLAACVPQWQPVKEGVLLTPGAQIEAADGDFFIWSGETFKPHFQSWTRLDVKHLTADKYYEALRGGGQRVKVMLPGYAPLYGILALEPLPPGGTSTGRGYQLDISAQCAAEAAAGTPCVDYEVVETDGGSQWIWALWLSDRPFK
jgi:hypothetical protein